MTFLEARGLTKIYSDMAKPVQVLGGLDFSMDKGQCIGIYGASGSGKSTFLHLLGGLDDPTDGEVLADGVKLDRLSDQELADFRNRRIGFVFQFYYLLPEFTALENVMMPVLIGGGGKQEAVTKASEALHSVGLGDRLEHRPPMLSG
ncbi:MAG: ATP-binding cassette domain-containing protein, partial [Deltaproteobacteria bacterium]|nr:ATP-binding cassette domain-containing protein [Deltaproteobacteria bacterium]